MDPSWDMLYFTYKTLGDFGQGQSCWCAYSSTMARILGMFGVWGWRSINCRRLWIWTSVFRWFLPWEALPHFLASISANLTCGVPMSNGISSPKPATSLCFTGPRWHLWISMDIYGNWSMNQNQIYPNLKATTTWSTLGDRFHDCTSTIRAMNLSAKVSLAVFGGKTKKKIICWHFSNTQSFRKDVFRLVFRAAFAVLSPCGVGLSQA